MRSCLTILVSVLSVCALAADTWQWLGKTKTPDSGSAITYGWTAKASANWKNVATGANGLPKSGDFVVSDGVGAFGSDFSTSLAFAGVSVNANVSGEFVSQGTLTLQAGGAGLAFGPKVTSVDTLNGFLAFAGSGEGVVDVRNAACTLSIQKGFYGNANITLVKKGLGALRANDYYHKKADSRDTTGGYYSNRRFVFGGLKLQEGKFIARQYYTVIGLDFQFDGDGTVLDLCGTSTKADIPEEGFAASWRLNGGKFRESANCAAGTHKVTAQTEKGVLELVGEREATSFSGMFTGSAGLVWNPSNDASFTFCRNVSDTKGVLAVSNGTVCVTEGAGFSALKALTVSGSNAVFQVDASANCDFAAVPFALADGGRLALAGGVRIYVKSVAVDGVALADGEHAGEDWIDGAGTVVIGGAIATWNGTGAATTLAHWSGASALPPLADGLTFVNVAGGTSFVADRDVWVDGFAVDVTPFALSAAAGRTLRIGGRGVTSDVNGKLTVGDAAGLVTVVGEQTWSLGKGALTFAGDIGSEGGLVNLTGTASPAFAGGITVGSDLRFFNGTTITCPTGTDLTFDGMVVATNTMSISVTAPAGSTITFNGLMMSRNGGTLGGAGRIVFNDSVHFRDRPTMSGTVVVELHKDGNRLNGNMGTFGGGTLRAMAPSVITKANARRFTTANVPDNSTDGGQNTMINAKDSFTLDLNGFDQSIDIVAMHADGTSSGGRVYSPTPATLHMQTDSGYWAQHNYRYGFSDYTSISSADGYGYETMDKGRWEGAVNLSYEAAAGKVRSMMRVSSTTGRVEVLSGKLVFLRRARTSGETFDLKGGSANPYPRLADEDGAWPLATAAVVKGGTLKLEHSLALGRDVDISLYTGGTLELDEGVVQACRSLSVDGERQEPGRYYDSGALKQIAGSGRLYVRGEAPSASVKIVEDVK